LISSAKKFFAVYRGRADQPTDGVPLTGSPQRNSAAASAADQLLSFLSSDRHRCPQTMSH